MSRHQTKHTEDSTHQNLAQPKVRIDKWLWAARFYKTRSMASDMVDGGKVKCNDLRVKPSYGVRVGDVLCLVVGWDEWVVEVKALSDKRGNATMAQSLYQETEESRTLRAQRAETRRLMKDPALEIKARPTKRDRRVMDAVQWDPS